MDTWSGYRFRSEDRCGTIATTARRLRSVSRPQEARRTAYRMTTLDWSIGQFQSLFRVLLEGSNYVTPSIYVVHCQAPTGR